MILPPLRFVYASLSEMIDKEFKLRFNYVHLSILHSLYQVRSWRHAGPNFFPLLESQISKEIYRSEPNYPLIKSDKEAQRELS